MPNPNWFWLVSFRPDSEESFSELTERFNSLFSQPSSSSPIAQLVLPDFKVASLSTLISLSEVLAKNETFCNQTIQKIVETLKTLLASKPSAFAQTRSHDSQTAGGVDLSRELEDNLLMDDGRSFESYLFNSWEWNRVKYNRVENRKLEEVVEALLKDVTSIDSLHKVKLSTYNQTKTQVAALRRKQNGNLSVKSLYDVVNQEHFVDPSSEFLETLLVAVPNNLVKDWINSYEHLTSLIVPRSSTKIASDDEFSLFNVTIFKKIKEDFVRRCREKKFIFREFCFDQNEIEKTRIEQREFELHEKELWSELLRLSRINFSDTFQAIVHLKVIQTYIESLLRFGLPPNFCTVVLKPDPKNYKKLLNQLISFHDSLEINNFGDGKNNSTKKNKKSRSKFGNGAIGNGNHDEELISNEYASVLEKEVYDFVLFEVLDPKKDLKEV
ncbi:ATPase, V1 complex, subunit C [Phakopsora pachyrhizi]|uniref:V-type proton ATPase subunit C n=1 Tax=Phakopsora pachyrhizi TaxID=170000 RepID=A0AAV0AZU9_PHAPC|nr:ATPase, V1 complex, subunit C [Phakopsora pachyrhizi]CAH7674556.1 ATPase, V1 complex, subunit C [Phakopsora pachyrhizi]